MLINNNDAAMKTINELQHLIKCFSLTYPFRPHYDPGVDSAFNRNE